MRLFFVLLLFYVGCISKEKNPPIPISQIAVILKEIHLAETFSYQQKKTTPYQRDSLYNIHYVNILQKYNLIPEQFDAYLDYFYQHPQELDSVYSFILNDLSLDITKKKNSKFPYNSQKNNLNK